MKIGIMGGTFDPIHNGHLIVAEYARTNLKLDKVIFIPSSVHPFKNNGNISSGTDRKNMVELSIESNPYFQISTMELDRVGTSYTVDTIKELKDIYKEDDIYFIMGADIIFEIEKWKDFNILIEISKFILFFRPGKYELKSEEKLKDLRSKYNVDITLIESPLIEISSTEIRNRINNNLSVKYLVHDKVEKYILENSLYRG